MADIVEFGEVNSLHGTVISFEEGVLVFSTKYVNRIRIPVDSIRSISTDKVVTIKMKDNSILRGTLTTLEDGQVAVILGPDGELVSLDWSQVKSINPPPQKWSGDFALGGNVKSGNTDSTNLNISFSTQRNWEHDRFKMRARFNFEEKNNEVTARNIFGALKFDHFFTENTFVGLSLESLKDEFKNINLQTILGLGLGYRIWNDDVKNLEIEAGAAFFKDDRDDGPDNEFASGRFGLTLSYKIFENLSIETYLLYYPSMKDINDSKLRNEASLISRLGVGWSIKLTHIIDQDTLVTSGVKEADNQFIFAVQYSF